VLPCCEWKCLQERNVAAMHLEFADSTSNDWLFGEDVLVTDESKYSSPPCS